MTVRPAMHDDEASLSHRERARLETLLTLRGHVTRIDQLSDDELRRLLREDASVSVGRVGASIDEPQAE